MTTIDVSTAAESLDQHYRAGTVCDHLPAALAPEDRAQGYAIQSALGRLIGGQQVGWKIAATSTAGQAHIGVDGPMAGRLFASRQTTNGGRVPFGSNRMRVAEIEFAFQMGQTLLPRAQAYTIDEVLGAVSQLHPAIEIPDSRYQDFVKVGAPHLIADNACAHRFVIGDAMPDRWRQCDLAALQVSGGCAGKEPVVGKGANALGDPRIALTWCANELSGLGLALEAGQIVMTGTCVVPFAIAPGDDVHGDFGDLGQVSVSIT